MRIAFFDPFSGASGDMILAALIDAGAPVEAIRQQLQTMELSGYTIETYKDTRGVIAGTRLNVRIESDQPQRDWRQIRKLIAESGLDPVSKSRALSIFQSLAEAEASVHEQPVDDVHFHEVGGVDSIVDICGISIAMTLLEIDQVYSAPVATGRGFVQSSHGLLPVPAPATSILIKSAGIRLAAAPPEVDAIGVELLTPTGAAVLATLADFSRPSFAPEALGYGLGSRSLPWPNALRVWIGQVSTGTPTDEEVFVVETNIDDMNPQGIELLMERLFAAGALDVWITPIAMKKQRSAVTISALAPQQVIESIVETLLRDSTTLGVRYYPVTRRKADRLFVAVTTRWGEVAVKLKFMDSRVIDGFPEHDDCARLASQNDIPLREVWFEARRLAESFFGRSFADLDQITKAASFRH